MSVFKGRAGCGELFNIMAHYGCCFYQSKIPLDILTKNMPIMRIMLLSRGVLFFFWHKRSGGGGWNGAVFLRKGVGLRFAFTKD